MKVIVPPEHPKHRIPIVDLEFHDLEVARVSAKDIVTFARQHGATSDEYGKEHFAVWFPSDRFPRLYTAVEVEEAVDSYQ